MKPNSSDARRLAFAVLVAAVSRSSLFLALLWAGLSLRAQQPPADPLRESLFPPELVIGFQSEIGLTEEQRDSIMATLQKMQPQFEAKQQQLRKEAENLAAVLNKERVEMESALTQMDKVLNLEREMKRAHLAMIIGIKNKLSPEQQAKLQEIKNQIASGKPPSSFQARMEAKMEKVKAGVEKWQNDGRDPSPIAEIMQKLEPLMKAGKVKEAEALLDKALKLLSAPEKEKSDDSEKKQGAVIRPQFQPCWRIAGQSEVESRMDRRFGKTYQHEVKLQVDAA